TEIQEIVRLREEFERRRVKIVGLTVGASIEEHNRFLEDLERLSRAKVWFPVVADPDGAVARQWGMVQRKRGRETRDEQGRPTAARTLYVLNPDLGVELALVNPLNTGRNFTEVLRVV